MEPVMNEPVPAQTQDAAGARRRRALAGGLFALAVAVGIGILSAPLPSRPLPPRVEAGPRLSDEISKTIETRGMEAALAQYRSLREQGFPGIGESEADTNRLGYRLLAKNEFDNAIQVFRLNAETHPGSANVHDSLGEAYLAAGNGALAAESYRKAVAINPRMKSAVSELRRLTGSTGKSYPPLVLLHI